MPVAGSAEPVDGAGVLGAFQVPGHRRVRDGGGLGGSVGADDAEVLFAGAGVIPVAEDVHVEVAHTLAQRQHVCTHNPVRLLQLGESARRGRPAHLGDPEVCGLPVLGGDLLGPPQFTNEVSRLGAVGAVGVSRQCVNPLEATQLAEGVEVLEGVAGADDNGVWVELLDRLVDGAVQRDDVFRRALPAPGDDRLVPDFHDRHQVRHLSVDKRHPVGEAVPVQRNGGALAIGTGQHPVGELVEAEVGGEPGLLLFPAAVGWLVLAGILLQAPVKLVCLPRNRSEVVAALDPARPLDAQRGRQFGTNSPAGEGRLRVAVGRVGGGLGQLGSADRFSLERLAVAVQQ